MVDLHDSLRPTGTLPPPPVTEIAARAKQRKRRRLVSGSGLAVVTAGVIAFALSSLPGSPLQTTVADSADGATPAETSASPTSGPRTTGFDDTTTVPDNTEGATSSTVPAVTSPGEAEPDQSTPVESGADDPTDDPTDSTAALPVTTTGIGTSTTITSEWDEGYCIQIEATNDGAATDDWQIVLDLGGTIATVWNVQAVDAGDGLFVFTGLDGYNKSLGSGAVTSFGTCVDSITDR